MFTTCDFYWIIILPPQNLDLPMTSALLQDFFSVPFSNPAPFAHSVFTTNWNFYNRETDWSTLSS